MAATAVVSGTTGDMAIITVAQVAFDMREELSGSQICSVEELMGEEYCRRYNIKPLTMVDKACYTETDRDLMEKAVEFVDGRCVTPLLGKAASLKRSLQV